MEMAFKHQILKVFVFVLFIFLTFPRLGFASSDYVLPYPSSMPGSKFYLLHQFFEKIEGYWYFGDFAKFHYNLKYSDRYLVEAKTLFEYKQYLLASQSLDKSDIYFTKAKLSIEFSKSNNKNTKDKEKIFKSASDKHIEILNQIKLYVPEEFNWIPEKRKSTKIFIKKELDESIRARDL